MSLPRLNADWLGWSNLRRGWSVQQIEGAHEV